MGPHGVIKLESSYDLLQGSDIEALVQKSLAHLARIDMPNNLYDLTEPIKYSLHVDNNGDSYVYFETVGR